MTTVFADEYGFNAGDATSALQAAIDDPNADRIVVRDVGSPWLISQQIKLKSNKEIVFEAGSVVQAKPGSFLANDRAMFFGLNIQNIKLIGEGSGDSKATLKMNKGEYNSNEFGHVVSLAGVDGYEVRGLKLTGGGGDGLHIAGGAFERPEPNVLYYSANGLVENITSDNNRRSAMSIDAAQNLIVRNSTFTNTSGTEPSAGINLEPTWDFESLQNVRIENVDVRGNDGKGVQVTLGNMDNSSPAISVDFSNVTLSDNRDSAIFVSGGYIAQGSDFGSEFKGTIDENSPQAQVNGTINFDNINISNPGTIASGNNPDTYIFIEDISGSQADPNNLKVNFNGVNVSDPVDTAVRTTPVFIQGLSGGNKPQEIGNISFNDVSITGNYNVDVVRADLGRGDASLNNVSGDVAVFNANPTGAGTFIDNEANASNLNLNVFEGNGTPLPASQTSAVISEPIAVVEPELTVETEDVFAEPIEPVVVEELEVAEPEAEVLATEVAAIETIEPIVAEELEVVEPEAEVLATEDVFVEPIEPIVVEELEVAEPEAEVLATEIAAVETIEPVVVEPEIIAEPELIEVVSDTEDETSDPAETAFVQSELEIINSETAIVEPSEPIDNIEAVNIITAEPLELAETSVPLVESTVSSIPIQNSSFTDNLSGWNPTGGNISVVERSLGDRWARIDAVGGINQDVSGLLVPGGDYQVSATTQIADSETRGYVGVRFTTATDELIDLKYAQVGSDTVREEQLEFTAPDNFAKAELFAFKNNGSASLFVDDFSITQQ